MGLGEAAASSRWRTALERHFRQGEDEDRFDLWHLSRGTYGLLIVIPAGVELGRPICLNDRSAGPVAVSDLVIVAEEGSRSSVMECSGLVTGDQATHRSSRVTIIAAAGAQVRYAAVQGLPSPGAEFCRRTAYVGQDASVSWSECSLGARFVRSRASSVLEGAGGTAFHRWAAIGNQSQLFDVGHEASHLARDTFSSMLFKAALADRSKAVVRGRVGVSDGAAGSSAFQRIDGLLLTDDAVVDMNPELAIADDDVKCGHAATISDIDDEQLFYLESRGLHRREAVRMLMEGFLSPLIVEFSEGTADARLSSLIRKKAAEVAGLVT